MPIVYILNGTIGNPVNISRFITNAQNNLAPGGSMPGRLPTGGAVIDLMTNQTALLNIGPVPQTVRVIGLITCAAVIYVSTDPGAVAGAWVHHANAGHVDAGDVTTARTQLGNPPWASILVIFAHPDPPDAGYNASMTTMVI
jgi:hypothetical protein